MEQKLEPKLEKQEEERKKFASREEFFGKLTGVTVLFLFAGIAGAVGFAVYRVIDRGMDDRGSIADLRVNEVFQETVNEEVELKEPEAALTPQTPSIDRSIKILVLNGGGPKGSAGEGASILKSRSFIDVSASNATGDYRGVTVYYLSDKEKVTAEEALKAVQEKYPKATLKQAEPASETASAPIVIVIGA